VISSTSEGLPFQTAKIAFGSQKLQTHRAPRAEPNIILNAPARHPPPLERLLTCDLLSDNFGSNPDTPPLPDAAIETREPRVAQPRFHSFRKSHAFVKSG
jgi:hypothetical protein